MKLANSLALFEPLKNALKFALMPTLKDILRGFLHNPLKVFSSRTPLLALRQTFFAHLWTFLSRGSDQNSRAYKEELLAHAEGVVLDLGAGLGTTLTYISPLKCPVYIAVEPNACFHPALRDAAEKAGYTEYRADSGNSRVRNSASEASDIGSNGSFILLPCGLEDVDRELAKIGRVQGNAIAIDTIISFLTLCSIPSPTHTHLPQGLFSLVSTYLKASGNLLLFEHIRHPAREDVAWWQSLWSPLWGMFFDGCRLDCDTVRWVQEMKDFMGGKEISMWSDIKLESLSEEGGEDLLYHVYGRLVKYA